MSVIKEHEIELNSIKYPITGQVSPILSAKFAEKMVIGDFTKASNPEVDSWVIQDQRGGILAEEMDEARQADRAYWSTCNLGFLGHITLPRQATAITLPSIAEPTIANGNFDTWAGGAPSSWDITTAVYEETVTYYKHSSSCRFDNDGGRIDQDLGGTIADFQNKTLRISYWVQVLIAVTTDADDGLYITDGTNTTQDSWDELAAIGTWYHRIVTHTVADDATGINLEFRYDGGKDAGQDTFVDDVEVVVTSGTAVDFCNFDGDWYAAFGQLIVKLDSTAGATFDYVYWMPYIAPTALISYSSYMFAYTGDTEYYWHMDTNDAFVQSNSANATRGIVWDSKLFKMNAAGLISSSTDPEGGAPTWADKGTLADEGLASGDVNELGLYRDAAGDLQVYAATKKGLYVHDFTNSKWLATELDLPDQATTGKGFVKWRDASYTSAGLDVFRYQTGGAGTSITSVGLNSDDGLPQLRGGEIVKFIKGYNEFFALVDSTYEGTGSRSTVMAYDGNGWQCWWESGSDNVHMYVGGVTTVHTYGLFFVAGSTIYRIPLQANIRNPKKISTFAYHTAGVHITPWFDANWVGTKLALQFKVFCKDTTADQDVLVEYRIDHATTAIAADGWTTLGTIVAAGDGVETTYTFGSSLGTNFKAIQFKFTLSRITTGTTPEYYSPDIQYAVLEYQKIIKPTWGWAFTIDCTNAYAGRTANQMLDAVVTAAELETLTPFLYKDTTYYVRVKSVEGERLTGDGRKGTYNVLVLKPI